MINSCITIHKILCKRCYTQLTHVILVLNFYMVMKYKQVFNKLYIWFCFLLSKVPEAARKCSNSNVFGLKRYCYRYLEILCLTSSNHHLFWLGTRNVTISVSQFDGRVIIIIVVVINPQEFLTYVTTHLFISTTHTHLRTVESLRPARTVGRAAGLLASTFYQMCNKSWS